MNIDYIVLNPTNPDYPANLTGILQGRPMYAIGNLDLLKRKAVGICGSRDASPEAHNYAFKFGKEAVEQGLVVVSGYARGVDRQAHLGALQAGGGTIAVIAEGLDSFHLVQDLKASIDFDNNFLAISMFEPQAIWKPWRAMERNKLIVSLSVAVFVVEARETGGTINAAMECVRQKKPLWAIAYSEPLPGRAGNRKLLQSSAIPLERQGDLRKAFEEASLSPIPEIKQLAFNLT